MKTENDIIYLLYVVHDLYDEEYPVLASLDEELLENRRHEFENLEWVTATKIESIEYMPS